MSIPLLKKSLELANTSYEYKEVKNKAGDLNKKQNHAKFSRKRSSVKEQRGAGDVRNCNVNKLKQTKKKIKKAQANLERTLKALKVLKKPCLDKNLVNIILERNKKPTLEEHIKVKEPEGTVFTEEDFANFEKCLRNEA